MDCTIRYTNSKFGEQEATTEIALSGDVPATIELTELVADQEYIFEALFVPADEELDDATRSVSYKTLAPPLPTPEYALTLLSVDDESAVIEATSNFSWYALTRASKKFSVHLRLIFSIQSNGLDTQ